MQRATRLRAQMDRYTPTSCLQATWQAVGNSSHVQQLCFIKQPLQHRDLIGVCTCILRKLMLQHVLAVQPSGSPGLLSAI
jgi:hypothetical protein